MYSKPELDANKEMIRQKKRDLADKGSSISDSELFDLALLNTIEEAITRSGGND